MEPKIRITLVEDHPEYRETIKLALRRNDGFELLGSFGTAERAHECFEASADARPDVLLLDLALPGISGLDALGVFRERLPDTRIVILTQSDSEADVIRAIAAGASGYLLKSSTVRQISDAIRSAVSGGMPLDPAVARYLVDTLRTKLSPKERSEVLSPREMEVLELLAEGKVQKEIAQTLGISPTTVITHVSHVYEKLDAKNAPAAVAKAFGIGILPKQRD